MGVTAQAVHGARVCLIPRPENNYRPLALHRRSLSLISAILIVAKITALLVVVLIPTPAELSTITAERIVQLTNGERKNAGLNELTESPKLNAAAKAKAQNMLEHDYFAHISPTGVTPWFWINQAGYQYELAGENLAIDFFEAEDVVAAWMASPSHKENILHSGYAETGVAVLSGEYQGGTSIVVVHMFGYPIGGPVLGESTTARIGEKAKAGAGEAVELPVSLTPSPYVSMPEEKDTIPAVPNISLLGNDGTIVQNSAQLGIVGDAGSIITILLNNKAASTKTLPSGGKAAVSLNFADLPDGEITMKAYASNALGQRSEETKILILSKDTTAPTVAAADLSFVLSPATDRPGAVMPTPAIQYARLEIQAGQLKQSMPYTEADGWIQVPVTADDISISFMDDAGNRNVLDSASLIPAFNTDRDLSYLETPRKLNRAAREITIVLLLILLTLLLMAIVIQINIQRPRMIAHACLVLLLAMLFLAF